MPWAIFDEGDRTWHVGEGEWSEDPAQAYPHPTKLEAEREMNEVDCVGVLRDRLRVAPAPEGSKGR